MPAFDSAHATVCELIEDFDAHKATYMDSSYSEARVRGDFIDKFWTALGWDVAHTRQKNPYEQEVRVEKTISVGGAQKRADYAFHLSPNFSTTLFFVEAKKPFAQLDAVDHCFQLVRYAWNAGCPLSVLHDFEELLVLDCRWRPDAATAQSRIWKRFHYTDFKHPEKFRFLYHLFSREAATEGAIAKRAAEIPKPRGRSVQRELFKLEQARIDEAFLDELEQWRADLAKAFKRENPELDSETLTEVTQRTLDRLVFLRFLEDKGIEQRTTVGGLGGASGSPWVDFRVACRRLDRLYNGAIFRLHPVLDAQDFTAGDDTFGGICEVLDAKNSVYDFNVIPIHILGSIYERFLGSVIIATDKRARVEQKPEVRKAGGVYYTPEYIVSYIVQQTVGKQLEGKTPMQIESLRFADIACGSGSFLLGVFDCLLRWHSAYYNEHPEKARLHSAAKFTKKGKLSRTEKAGDCFADPDTGALRLTLEKKRQILLNNVFGTDLDPQAVEVAQFSLYLKLLEDETAGSAHQYQLDFEKEALLPALEDNIVCGNALIGTDIAGLFSLPPEEEEKLRPMDYETTFPQVFAQGGFDAIVGNPPWGAEFTRECLEYIKDRNREIIVRMIDSFMFFLNKCLTLLSAHRRLGMIFPDVLFYQTDCQKLREKLLSSTAIHCALNMGDVFDKVTRPSCIIVVQTGKPDGNQVNIADYSALPKADKPEALGLACWFSSVPQTELRELPGAMIATSRICDYKIWRRMLCQPHETLAKVVDSDGIQRGVSPDLKEAFLLDSTTAKQYQIEERILRPVVTGGRHVRRYRIEKPDLLLIYTKRDSEFAKLPNTMAYVDRFRTQITCKEVKEGKHSLYALHRAREEHIFTKPSKILGVITEDEIIVCPDTDQMFATDGLYLFGVSPEWHLNYVIGVLNSKLLVFIYRLLTVESGRVLAQVKPTVLNQIPIRIIDPGKPADRARHDKMVDIVTEMLEAKKQEAAAVTDTKRDFWMRKCATLDRQIDALVYDLYGLTPEEIALVEGSTTPAAAEGKEADDE